MSRKEEILPRIYSSGIFKLKGKLGGYLSESLWYTCIAIRKIEEIEALGIDCFNEFYKPIGLDEADFQKDAEFNACVITVKSSNGDLKHFPSTYLLSFPNGSGILYNVMGIAFDLGPLPLEYDLSVLDDKLKSVIRDTLGINSRSRLLTLSNTEIITQATHERLLKEREAHIKTPENLSHANKQLANENKELKKKINELEKWIIEYYDNAKKIAKVITVSGFTL